MNLRQAQEQSQRNVKAFRLFLASLPSGTVLGTLEVMAKAQFLEGMTGHPFNSVVGRAAKGGIRALQVAIAKMMLEVDPMSDPSRSLWTQPGSSMYKAAWFAANSVTKPYGLDASDVLAEDMVRALAFGSSSAAEDSVNPRGSLFYLAGKAFRDKAEDIVSGVFEINDLLPRVNLYAKNLAINFVKHKKVQDKADAKAVAEGMLPGVVQTEDGIQYEQGDFDADTMGAGSWGAIVAAVLANPREPISQEVFDWLRDWVDNTSRLTDLEKRIVGTYLLELSTDGTSTSFAQLAADFGVSAGFVSQLMSPGTLKKVPAVDEHGKPLSDGWGKPRMFTVTVNMGRFPTLISQALKNERPAFLNDLDNMRELAALASGGAGAWKFASVRTAAEKALRSKLIRLASERPELRPVLLPLIKKADEEAILAGRPWGGTGYKSKAKDYDDPSPGPGSPPCTPEGEGGCYEHTDMYNGYGSANSGTNGSAARREYNKKYRESM